eukprot:11912080-Alexandrium_andersonii.AAC.1
MVLRPEKMCIRPVHSPATTSSNRFESRPQCATYEHEAAGRTLERAQRDSLAALDTPLGPESPKLGYLSSFGTLGRQSPT